MKILFVAFLLLMSVNVWCQSAQYEQLVKEGIDLRIHKRHAIATEQFRKAIVLDSNKVDAYYEMGITYMDYFSDAGTYSDSCIYYLYKALGKDSTYKYARASLGQIKGKLHDFEGALLETNIAIITKPDSSTYLQRALIRFKLNDEDGVCADLDKAIKLGSTKAREIVANQMLGINCPSIELKDPKDILLRSYSKMMEKHSVAYNITCTHYTNFSKANDIRTGKVVLLRAQPDTSDGFYFWVAQSDTTLFFSDMHQTYGTNKKHKATTVYEAYYFMVNFIVDKPFGELIWTSFATPDKLKEKTDAPFQLSAMADTVYNGTPCYRVLVKYPGASHSAARTLLMHISKKDYAPFFLVSTTRENERTYYGEVLFSNYVFDTETYSRFSKEQIPKSYKVSVYKSELDK